MESQSVSEVILPQTFLWDIPMKWEWEIPANLVLPTKLVWPIILKEKNQEEEVVAQKPLLKKHMKSVILKLEG